MAKSMQHWNGHQACVIDCETTGLDPHHHEIIQLAIVPLDSNFKARKGIMPLYIHIQPDYPERADPKAMDVNKLSLAKISLEGFDREKAKDLVQEWSKKLELPCTKYGNPKKIMPLGQNYAFDRSFLIAWLGSELYNEIFFYHYKDTMIAAQYLNDRAAMHAEKVPFSKINLSYLCSTLKIKRERSHDALQDCLATAEVYRQMLQQGLMG